jgi:hypothetical protein
MQLLDRSYQQTFKGTRFCVTNFQRNPILCYVMHYREAWRDGMLRTIEYVRVLAVKQS